MNTQSIKEEIKPMDDLIKEEPFFEVSKKEIDLQKTNESNSSQLSVNKHEVDNFVKQEYEVDHFIKKEHDINDFVKEELPMESEQCAYSELKEDKNMEITKDDENISHFMTKRHTWVICSFCNRSFRDIGSLKTHQIIHTVEKPYKCDHCNKCFSLVTNLKKHLKIHTNEKPYKCNHCDKSFTEKGNLKKHLTIHTGEKHYKCNHCDKSFNRSDMLRTHLRFHAGEKPYKCDHCDKSFKKNHSLALKRKTCVSRQESATSSSNVTFNPGLDPNVITDILKEAQNLSSMCVKPRYPGGVQEFANFMASRLVKIPEHVHGDIYTQILALIESKMPSPKQTPGQVHLPPPAPAQMSPPPTYMQTPPSPQTPAMWPRAPTTTTMAPPDGFSISSPILSTLLGSPATPTNSRNCSSPQQSVGTRQNIQHEDDL